MWRYIWKEEESVYEEMKVLGFTRKENLYSVVGQHLPIRDLEF